MKAILVIDMPDKCSDCPLMSDKMYCKAFKGEGIVTKRCVEDYVMQGARHPYCSLKPMPQKSTYELADDHPYSKAEIMAYTYGITVGRNQVIEEITE